jgi:hypothetical protein
MQIINHRETNPEDLKDETMGILCELSESRTTRTLNSWFSGANVSIEFVGESAEPMLRN